MDIKTKEIYSEVYSVLNMLGDTYITKLPSNLYKIIKEEKSDEYNPYYDSNITLEKQNIRKESISMIALFHFNYWCSSQEEKEELFNDNELKYQEKLKESFNPDDLFKNRNNTTINEEEVNESVAMVTYKESIFNKILKKIKKFFHI